MEQSSIKQSPELEVEDIEDSFDSTGVSKKRITNDGILSSISRKISSNKSNVIVKRVSKMYNEFPISIKRVSVKDKKKRMSTIGAQLNNNTIIKDATQINKELLEFAGDIELDDELEPIKKRRRSAANKKAMRMLLTKNEIESTVPEKQRHYFSWSKFWYIFDRKVQFKKYQLCFIFLVFTSIIFSLGIIYKFCLQPQMGILLAFFTIWGFLTDQGLQDTISESNVQANNVMFANATYFSSDPALEFQVWSQRLFGAFTTALGILLTSLITGFVVDAVRERMEFLKEGKRLHVIEYNHIVMIGWTEKSISIIRWLAEANASIKGTAIVVLAEKGKEDIELEINRYFPHKKFLMGTRVIVTTGIKTQAVDLLNVAVHHARCVLVLADNSLGSESSDANALQTVLSLRSLEKSLLGYIVCELLDKDNENLVKQVGGSELELVITHDIIGRLMVMASREPGLSRVYEEILGFEGDEFYIKQWPELVGKEFKDLMFYFPDAIIIGVLLVEDNVNWINLSPSQNHIMGANDWLIVIAEDDDLYMPTTNPVIDISVKKKKIGVQKVVEEPTLEKILICGWRRDLRDVIKFLDCILAKGSELHILSERPIQRRLEEFYKTGFLPSKLKNVSLVHYIGAANVRRNMQLMDIEKYKCGLIFADEKYELNSSSCDSVSLATLVLIRDTQSKYAKAHNHSIYEKAQIKSKAAELNTKKTGDATSMKKKINNEENNIVITEMSFPLVVEVLDQRTQKTISKIPLVSQKSDFVQTNDFSSRLMAMVVEDRRVMCILNELLGADGHNFFLKPSNLFVDKFEEINFYELAFRVQLQGFTLVGFMNEEELNLISVNPKDKNASKSWGKCRLIVVGPSIHVKESEYYSPPGIRIPHPNEVNDNHSNDENNINNANNSESNINSPGLFKLFPSVFGGKSNFAASPSSSSSNISPITHSLFENKNLVVEEENEVMEMQKKKKNSIVVQNNLVFDLTRDHSVLEKNGSITKDLERSV